MRAGCDACSSICTAPWWSTAATMPRARSAARAAHRPDLPIAVTLRLPHQPVAGDRRQRHGDHRLQDLSARRHVRGRACSPATSSRDRCAARSRPVMAWGWLPLVVLGDAPRARGRAVGRHPRATPAPWKNPAACWRRRCCRAFPHADTPYTGVSAVVVADALRGGREAAAQEVCDRMLAIAWERRAEYVFHPQPLAESVARARALGAGHPGGPVLLIDHCDNCGSGGAQDVMLVVGGDPAAGAGRRRHRADPRPAGGGADGRGRHRQQRQPSLGGKTDMPSIGLAGRPLAGRRPRAQHHRRRNRVHRADVYRPEKPSSGAPRCSTPGARRSSSPSATTSRSTW